MHVIGGAINFFFLFFLFLFCFILKQKYMIVFVSAVGGAVVFDRKRLITYLILLAMDNYNSMYIIKAIRCDIFLWSGCLLWIETFTYHIPKNFKINSTFRIIKLFLYIIDKTSTLLIHWSSVVYISFKKSSVFHLDPYYI